MPHTLVILGILLAVIAAVIYAYRAVQARNARRGGFRDYVKNPEYKQAANAFFQARNSLTVPDDISDTEIQQMVDRLFVAEDSDFNYEQLELVGEKAVPFLIEALEDPRTAEIKFQEWSVSSRDLSTFGRICELLEPFGPVDAVKPLIPYVDHEDKDFRKQAAVALGNIGSTECIEPLLEGLDDDDDHIRTFAMYGIQRGISGSRCTREFLGAMFPAVTKLIEHNDQAAKTLLKIDAGRALPILLSPEVFSVENRKLFRLIRAVNESGQQIPHDVLLPFLETVKPLSDKFPHDNEYAEALRAYANNPDEGAEEMFRAELDSPKKRVKKAAAEALAKLSGVTDAREFILDAVDNLGFDGLSLPQQYYYTVFVYDAEVTNGGHAQYFVNSSGDRWKTALAGLKDVGDHCRADVLKQATALFGTDGPPEENDPRHRQLAKFSRNKDKALDELDDKYYACDENVMAMLAQYALENKEHFIKK